MSRTQNVPSNDSAPARLLKGVQEQGVRIITARTAAEILRTDVPTARTTLARLVERGWLIRQSRGVFSLPAERSQGVTILVADARLGSRPHYVAFRTALQLQGMTLHSWREIQFAAKQPTRIKMPDLAPQVRVVQLSPNRFFGMTWTDVVGERVSVSDPEKSVIDALSHLDLVGGAEVVLQALWLGKE